VKEQAKPIDKTIVLIAPPFSIGKDAIEAL
jgi:hypothetical protein